MSNYIESAAFSIQAGALAGTMQFQRGLNLLSGENGTFKTKLLQALRGGANVVPHENDPERPLQVQAISPKRNAQRRAVQEIYNDMRRGDKKLEQYLTARKLVDTTFEEYPSLGDLFYVVYDDLCRDGGNQVEKMNETVNEFNSVIRQIFEHYELQARWDATLGAPQISMLKHRATEVPLEGLSLGEQEILSFATYIHSSRNSYDAFLIDEPEVHLNWHLEEKLFGFLDDYCEAEGKQMIVVTHSRVVFTQRFLPKTTFLFWENGKVQWGKELDPEQRRRLAGDAIEIIRLGAFSKPVVFVEDGCQVLVVEQLSRALGADILISQCGNKSNVRSLYKFSQMDNWPDSYFIEDGDNEGSPFDDPHFIHLDKYCIECYLLNVGVAAAVTGCTEDEIRQAIFDSIIEKKELMFRRDRFFEFLIDNLTVEHITEERLGTFDASLIFGGFLRRLNISQADYVDRYVRTCQSQGTLGDVLPEKVVELIERAVEETAVSTEASETIGSEKPEVGETADSSA